MPSIPGTTIIILYLKVKKIQAWVLWKQDHYSERESVSELPRVIKNLYFDFWGWAKVNAWDWKHRKWRKI